MSLLVEKRIRGGVCHKIIGMQNQIITVWKILIKTLNHHTSCI